MQRKPYTVQVHLIEARGLVARKGKESTDSFCMVSVAGRKDQTEIQRNTVNCVWDEVFIFENIMLTDDEFERENIYLYVFEANTFWRNELIGRYTFGMAKVNRQRHDRHQFFRTWLVLTEPNDPAEEQGYVKATVTVLGPGDKPPSHESTQVQRDDEAGDVILRPPTVARRGYNLNIKIYRAEDLPEMDPVSGSCDPFVSVKFNGNVQRTNIVRRDTKPVWLQHIWLPVYTPCMSDNIDIQLWDWNRANPDELIATHRVTFSSLLSSSFGPAWVNLYGSPVDEGGIFGWLAELVQSGDVEQTAYLGKLLIAMNASMTDTPSLGDRSTPPAKEPRTAEYELRFDLYAGTEIPVGFKGEVMVEVCFGPARNTRQSDWVEMNEETSKWEFSVGTENPKSSATDKPTEAGMCQFKEIVERLPRCKRDSEPWQLAQLYDTVVNVYTRSFTGSVQRVGYLRYTASEIWGWNHKPEWHAIRPVVQTNGRVSAHAGFLLFNIEFGPRNMQPRPPKRGPMEKMKPKKYEVRAYIYQARHLPALNEEDATCPCKVSMNVGGQEGKLVNSAFRTEHDLAGTQLREGSLNPVWYQILRIPEVDLSDELSLAPPIQLKVLYTENGVVKQEKVVGHVEFPTFYCAPDAWPAGKGPKWLRLTPESGDRSMSHGDLLVRLEVLQKAEAAQYKMEEHLWPDMRNVKITVAAVGLRNLAPLDLLSGNISNPVLEMEMPQPPPPARDDQDYDSDDSDLEVDTDNVVVWSSESVSGDKFSGPSPNLLEAADILIRAPNLPHHLQPLTVRVFERSMTGRRVVGYLEIPVRRYSQSLFGDAALGDEFVDEAPEFHHTMLEAAPPETKDNDAEEEEAAEFKGGEGDEGPGEGEEEEEGAAAQAKAVVPKSLQDRVLPLNVNTLNVDFDDEISQVEEDMELENVDMEEQGETEVYWPGDDGPEDEGPRRVVKEELETEPDFRPLFEDFCLVRGVKAEGYTFRENAGVLKAYVTVVDRDSFVRQALADDEDERERVMELDRRLERLDTLREEKEVKVRVYVIQGHSLLPKGFGRKANPYVVLSLKGRTDLVGAGERIHHLDDAVNMLTDTLSPEFYKPFELDATIPDVSTLHIEVRDGSSLLGAEIGRTLIDLEDRWIHPNWEAHAKSRDIPKEFRTLWNPSTPGVPQGKLELWLEMYEAEAAADIPFVPIEAPKPEEWELRLVVWQARKVPLVDGGKSVDIYVNCEMITAEGEKGESLFPSSDKFDTDVHNGSKDGSGTFNYRMLFPVMIPSRLPRLKVQVWDQDLFSADTFIGEANVNMSTFFSQALDNGERVDRGRTWIKMSHPKHPNDPRGEVELQMTLLTRKLADKKPVGAARGEPNEDPFLPDVVRPPRFGFGGGGGRGKLYFYLVVFLILAGVVGWQTMGK